MAGRPDWDIWRGRGTLAANRLPGRTAVFVCRPDTLAPEERELFFSWLDSGERERLRGFLFEKDRLLFGIAHGLARYALSLWRAEGGAPTAPGEWRFRLEPAGRPRAVFPEPAAETGQPPAFSLSHTRGAAAVAVASSGRLGADAERSGRRTRAMELARRFFAPEECAELAAIPEPGRRRERFIRLWTLKEAYLKALGVGLGKALDSFAMTFAGGAPGLLWDRDGSGSGWRFASAALAGGLRISLAAEGGEGAELLWLEGGGGRGWGVPAGLTIAKSRPDP